MADFIFFFLHCLLICFERLRCLCWRYLRVEQHQNHLLPLIFHVSQDLGNKKLWTFPKEAEEKEVTLLWSLWPSRFQCDSKELLLFLLNTTRDLLSPMFFLPPPLVSTSFCHALTIVCYWLSFVVFFYHFMGRTKALAPQRETFSLCVFLSVLPLCSLQQRPLLLLTFN